jgi:hypothetical protein
MSDLSRYMLPVRKPQVILKIGKKTVFNKEKISVKAVFIGYLTPVWSFDR